MRKREEPSGRIHQRGLIQKQRTFDKDKIPLTKEIIVKDSKKRDQRDQAGSNRGEEDLQRDAGELQQPKR